MDLIYTDSQMSDVGVLLDYQFDLAFGQDENDFECKVATGNHCCEAGYYLHIEGTEYGGIVDGIAVDTEADTVTYSGRTWHGILESRIILPLQEGEASSGGVTIKTANSDGASLVNKYLVISGDVNRCIQFILNRIGLSSLFVAPKEATEASINNYQFNRYTDAYTGIVKMLESANMRINIEYSDGKVIVSAVERYDYTHDEEFDPSLVELSLKKKFKTVNHLICLGSGELENRMVRHLYADVDGVISETQTQTGMDEYSDVFDFPSVESEEELVNNGIERLKELWQPDELIVDMDDTSDFYNVGDTVGATDEITKLFVVGTIQKKIVTIENGRINISYKVGG